MKKIVFITLLIGILVGCSKQVDDPIFNDPTIIGIWVQDTSKDYSIVKNYTRKDSFEINMPGLKFSENGDFIFRDKCACPESQYENYFGNYTLLNDSTINVSYKVENETKEKTIKINSITLDTLKVSFK